MTADRNTNRNIRHISGAPYNGPKRKRRYSDGSVVLGFMLALLVLYVVGYTITFMNRERVMQTVVTFGTVEPVLVFRGVIIRDETVYYSDAAGIVRFHVPDFERVRAGSPGASVMDEETVQRHFERILSIEDSLLRGQEGRNLSPYVYNELRNLNNQMIRFVNNNVLAVNEGDMQAMQGVTQRVSQLMENRNTILLNEARTGPTADLAAFQNQMGEAISEIRVGPSGLISYRVDGYEYIFTPDRLRTLSREETLTYVDYFSLHAAAEVSPGDPVFKTVNSNNWHVAAVLPLEQVADWQIGEIREIYADDGNGNFGGLTGRVHYLNVDPVRGEVYVVMHFDTRVAEFMDRRSMSFKIRQGLAWGLKIPNTAITERTLVMIPRECVFVFDRLNQVLRFNPATNGFDIVTITIFQSNADFHMILYEYNDIRVGDTLAVPDSLGETRPVRESEVIRGVYVTNTGVAVFRRVHLSDESFRNLNYTVIDPNINMGVRVSDRIAVDADSVYQNMMIF